MRHAIGARSALRALLALALLGLSSSVVAHHSFIGRFDLGVVTEIEGVVTDVAWRNPHAVLGMRTTSADGTTDWSIETSSLTVLRRMGIEEGTIKVGDRIKL